MYQAIGTMVLSVGIYLSVTNHSLALITGDTNISGAVLLILSGGITLVVALLGVCGSLFPKKWLLILVRKIINSLNQIDLIVSEFK